MAWALVAVLLAFSIFQFSAARRAYWKLNALNEYVQFLIFQPQVYEDHRKKFLAFVSQNTSSSISDQAMASYQAIDDMAAKLENTDALLSNVKSRGTGGSPK